MVTCYLKYVLDPFKLEAFEHYGKLWIPLVEKFGGQHHGYFLPSEGANNIPQSCGLRNLSPTVDERPAVHRRIQVRRRNPLHPEL